jgi:crotonobetainyl-CoA:carnitine CoA-transferase CaiB-like acyl-CoA transferase
MESKGPLDGIRVFDMTTLMVGPWAGKLLGALGADVLRVIQPDVDWATLGGAPPTINGTAGGYIAWNMNKRSVFLDLKDPEDRTFAEDLVATCDVFLCNMRTGVPDRLGLGYDAMASRNPGLVYCLATGYGRTGPRANDAAMDDPIQVTTGFWSTQGARGGLPEMYRHHTQMDATAGNILASAALLGLYARRGTGRGQLIDITMFDSAATLQLPRISEFLAGYLHEPIASSSYSTAPNRAFRCEDQQWIGISVTSDPEWRAFCSIPECTGLASRAEFATTIDRVHHRAALEAELEGIVASKPLSYWALNCDKRRLAWGAPLLWETLRHHPQARENGYLVDIDTPVWGTVTTGGAPWIFEKTPARFFSAPVPGNDTFEVREEVANAPGHTSTPGEPTGSGSSGNGAPSDGPLSGVRVVEVASGVAGPMATRMLGDAGADVVKVEGEDGDETRAWGPCHIDGASPNFLALNRNKRSAVLAPDAPEFAELLESADVLVVDDGALDIDEIRVAHPRLVVCVISAWGPKGPWAHRRGGELPAQLAAEVTSSLGRIGEEPVRLGNDHAGALAAIHATQGIVAALLAVERSGGQRIDVSLFGSLLEMRSTLWVALSNPDEWWGFHLDSYVKPPEHGYTCSDGRIWFNLARLDDFDALIADLDMEFARDDPRWEMFRHDRAGVDRNVHVIYDIWDAGLRRWTVAEALEILGRHGGLAFPLATYDAFLSDPQVHHLGMVVESKDSAGRMLRDLRPPWQFSATPPTIRRPPPELGEHTAEILGEVRGGSRVGGGPPGRS